MSFAASQSTGPALLFEYDVMADRWICSEGLRELYGIPPSDEVTTAAMSARVLEDDRTLVMERFDHHRRHAGPFSLELRIAGPSAKARRLILVGQSEASGGEVKRMSGFVVDITDSMREEAAVAVLASAEHRATIEQAKGALMLGFGIGDDAAFDLLRTYSNRHNMKLVRLADYLTSRLADPAYGRDDAVRSLLDILIELEETRPA